MPSPETIELTHIKKTQGLLTDLPKSDPRSSIVSRIRTLLLDIGNVPILRHLYGSSGKNKTLTLDTTDSLPYSIFSDGTNLYIGTNEEASGNLIGRIVKVDLKDFVRVDAITFDFIPGVTEELAIRTMFSDGINIYACGYEDVSNKTYVKKIDIATFSVQATVLYDPGVIINPPRCIWSDGTVLYMGMETNPGTIVRIDIETFTIIDTLTLSVANMYVYSMFGDESFLYVTCGHHPITKTIVKVHLSSFTQVGYLSINNTTFTSPMYSIFIDGNTLYASCEPGNAGTIVKVDLITFSIASTLVVGAYPQYMFIDATFLYVALAAAPAKVARVDLTSFTVVSTDTFAIGEDYIKGFFTDETFVYAGISTIPGKIVRRYLLPTNNSADRRISLINEQTRSGTYYIRPSNAVGTTVTSGAGVYTKGAAYTEIIAVNIITTNFYIDSVFLNTQTVTRDFEIDIATGLAGSEVIIATVSNMVSNTNDGREYKFNPQIKVPANTRISARCSDSTGSGAVKVKIRYRI